MRIALLTHQWPGIRMGGIGAAVRQTAAALAAIGHDVHVFTLSIPDDLKPSIPKDVHFHPIADLPTRVQQGGLTPQLSAVINAGGEGSYRLALAWLLCAALQEVHAANPFDIVEAPEVEALAMPLMLNADFNAPLVTHLHCCTALARLGNQSTIESTESLTTALEFAAIHLADRICAPTRAVVRGTERFMPIAPPVAILPHPYDSGPAPFVSPPADGPMLFIGRIEHLKGITSIVQALNIFLPRHPQAVFRFIGPDTPSAPGGGSMRQYVQSLLSPEIASRTQFAGELSHAQIERELHKCSFCVQPSLWENFSMTCCEAFAAGRTVIVGQGTGSVELIGDAGLAIDPQSPQSLAEAMERLWSDRSLLAQLSQRAHTRIRTEFAPALIAGQRAAFYRDAIAAFRENRRTNLPAKLTTLPSCATAAILPALSDLTGMLAGVHHPTQSPGARLLKIMDGLSDFTGRPAQVLLYGAGKYTARLFTQCALWESKGHRIIGLIDDHPRFATHPTYLDLPVQSIKAAIQQLSSGQELPPIILSTDTCQDQFWAQTQPLRDKGVPVFRL